MKYEYIKEFIVRTKASKSKIYRFYKKNQDLWDESRMKYGKRQFPVEHVRYFDSEIMFDENKVLRQENQSMRNLIDCLVDKDSLQYKLWQMDWSFFFTVAYKTERNKKSCVKQMHSLYEYLEKKYGDRTDLRLFFSTEAFSDRQCYHNHFVLNISNKKMEQEVVEAIQKYFRYDRLDVRAYDKYKAGIFYASKEGLVNEDWDILGNNLKQDGIDASKSY